MSDLPVRAPSNHPVPAMLDRGAVERVLARASELQATGGEGAIAGGGLLSEEQIVELGQEVGLSPAVLRQALAEERTRVTVPEEHGWVARLAGPAVASASRTVRGTGPRTLAALDQWMQKEECLQVKRRYGERITWEARKDLWGSLRRSLNVGGRGYALSRAEEVAGTVVPVDEHRVLVRLEANLAPSRTARLQTSGAAAAAGLATGGVAGTITAMVAVPSAIAVAAVAAVAVVPVAIGAGAAYAIARQHGDVITRAQLALEQILDHLSHA